MSDSHNFGQSFYDVCKVRNTGDDSDYIKSYDRKCRRCDFFESFWDDDNGERPEWCKDAKRFLLGISSRDE